MRSRAATVTFLVILTTMTVPAPARATVNSFVDDDTNRFEPFIEAATELGVISSCNPPQNDRVCPNDSMTRGQTVVMLARAIGLDQPSESEFLSDDGLLGELTLGALAGAGIPTGCDAGEPCPDRPINRGEMAALFARAFRWSGDAGTSGFVDIADSPYADDLAELATRGGLLACDSPIDQRLCPGAMVRRDEATFAIVSVMGLVPVASQPSPEPPPIGFSDGFDALSLWDGRTPSYRNRVEITGDGYHDSGLRVTIPKGSHYGANFHLHVDDQADVGPDQLFFRYYLKLDPDWNTSSSGKLPGFSGVYGATGKGGYQSTPSDPGWSARLMFSPATGGDPRVHLGYYVYHLGQETRYGDGVGWNEAGRLRPGEWYCLEGEVDMNTPGIADGSLRAWVDETPALDISGLQFRRPGEPEINIESFWFNVYYGGKRVPGHDLGLTFDEVAVDTHRVGCADGAGHVEPASGDFDGDGYDDKASWDTCLTGVCLEVSSGEPDGSTSVEELRDTAWFSVESRLVGTSAGDLDGDGNDEIVYRGRCDASIRCWRVERDVTDRATAAENWGDGGRFSVYTGTPALGDWDGDGLDDLVYQGLCGNDRHLCWRVHRSTGSTFAEAEDWGPVPRAMITVQGVDLSGDGREDLLYRLPCGESVCWFSQISTTSGFDTAVNMGEITSAERDHFGLFDFDGNGRDDLVAWSGDERSSRIELRYAAPEGFTSPVVLATIDGLVHDVRLGRASAGAPVQASLRVDCGEGSVCPRVLGATSDHSLEEPARYRSLALRRLGLPPID